ncbi:MAG: NAD(P)/FAD-dependent oxidoreductase [Deltaproteobacteria bacterium]|nr:NAD(P)/FAD-dependent oxidoreductase [Deltaproteobacteria bacterium]
MADYDAIVIGSGAGGLSAALKLARSDYSVMLLEAMPSFGGYLNPFRRKGYTFDTGLHYLGELGEEDRFWRLLDELGVVESMKFVELNPEGFDRYVFPDYELRVCKGKNRFMERLINDFPAEEPGIHKFFNVFEKIIRAVKASHSMGRGVLQMLSFIVRNPVMVKYSRVPYQKLLNDVTSDKRLQAALAAPCGDYGVPPEKASIIIAVMVWAHYLKGAFYPCGGSGALRDAFVNGLKDHGAELKKSSKVISIDKTGNKFIITTEHGEKFSTRAVISDVDPVVTLGKLVNPELVPTKIKRKVMQLRPSGGSFYAFIGTDLDLPSMGITDANIIHYSDYDINKLYTQWPVSTVPEVFPAFFITSPSVKDPEGGHAPEGYHTVEIITGMSYKLFEKWAHLPSMKRGEEYTSLKERIGERLVASAERYIPTLSQHIDFVEYATPLSNEYWVNAVRGGNYGPEQTFDQVGTGRFISFTAGIDGLFLAGAGTMGGGVMACLESGIQAARKAAIYMKD